MNGLDLALEPEPEVVVARQLLHQAYRNLLELADPADPAQYEEVIQLYRNVLRWLSDCGQRMARAPAPARVCDLERLHLVVSRYQAGDAESLRILNVDAAERRGVETIDAFLAGRSQTLDLIVDPAAHDPSLTRGDDWIRVELARRSDGWIDVICREAGVHDHVALFVALRYFFNSRP